LCEANLAAKCYSYSFVLESKTVSLGEAGGRFGVVLPNTAIDREHYSGFRCGRYGGELGVF
jgi:hypothetical protein